MDWLKDFINPFRERFKSKFYATVFVSWIICNWEIPTALITDTRYFGNGKDKIYFISTQLDICTNFNKLLLLPLVFSGIYLYGFPKIDRIIYDYNERENRRKKAVKVKSVRKFGATAKEYLELYFRYEKLEEKVNAAALNIDNKASIYMQKIDGINQTKKELEQTRQDLLTQTQNNETLKNKLNENTYRKNAAAILNDIWVLTLYNTENRENNPINIKFDTYSISIRDSENQSTPLAEILYFDFENHNKKISIILKNLKLEGNTTIGYVFCTLNHRDNEDKQIYSGQLLQLTGNTQLGNKIEISQRK